jgi:NADPH:quinone reductase-like Zn-dependent oxidoreductase
MRMRHLLRDGALLGLSGSRLVASDLLRGQVTVEIPQDAAQEHLDNALPFETSRNGIDMVIDSARLSFLATNKARIAFDGTVNAFGFSMPISGSANASLRYADLSFYLDQLCVEDLSMSTAFERSLSLSRISDGSQSLWSRMTRNISSDFVRTRVEDMKTISMNEIKAFVHKQMQDIPIHKLNATDTKTRIAAATLRQITFHENKARLILSLKRDA